VRARWIAEELRLPLGEDCSPPAQETLLGTLGSASSALPLIKDKPGFVYHPWPWALGRTVVRPWCLWDM
jgi:hypothetical protein